MSQHESTRRLVAALEAANDRALADVLRRARSDYYNDYFGVPDFPEMTLVADLREAGHEALAQRVIAGEFDGTRAESDEWAASPEGRATLAELPEAMRKQMGGK